MISAALDAIQTAWKMSGALLFAIVVVVSALLFIDEDAASRFNLVDFRNEHKAVLGPVLLSSSVLLITKLASWGFSVGRETWHGRKRNELLHGLTDDEKGYLAQFIVLKKTVIQASLEDGVIGSLRRKGIVVQASQMGHALDGFEFIIEDWARSYLTKKPQLLDGGTAKPLTPAQRFNRRTRS